MAARDGIGEVFRVFGREAARGERRGAAGRVEARRGRVVGEGERRRGGRGGGGVGQRERRRPGEATVARLGLGIEG